jgi:hypothetical protein
MDRPEQTPEGRLIADAMKRLNISARKAAEQAGMSDARWRHIVNGYQPLGRGENTHVSAPAVTLARMALVTGVSADELRAVGRADAADELTNLTPMKTVEINGLDEVADLDFEIGMIERSDLPRGMKNAMIREAQRLRRQQLADQEALRQRQADERREEVGRWLRIATEGNALT